MVLKEIIAVYTENHTKPINIKCSVTVALHRSRGLLVALMMEAASTSETENFYQITRRNNPEDSHLHTSRRENLKSRCSVTDC
jgi:hypothetical protein